MENLLLMTFFGFIEDLVAQSNTFIADIDISWSAMRRDTWS